MLEFRKNEAKEKTNLNLDDYLEADSMELILGTGNQTGEQAVLLIMHAEGERSMILPIPTKADVIQTIGVLQDCLAAAWPSSKSPSNN